ncbi:MAG: Ig-like domain-containing protein, partial [Planctomycetota bacterium]
MFTIRTLGLLFIVLTTTAAELTVGPGKMYAKPSQAAAAANDGDTISIDAGSYVNDACTWSRNKLLIRGVGVGRAHIANGYNVVSQGKGIWVISGSNTTIQNIEVSGAAIPGDGSAGSENGAGMRLEGSGVTISNCYFHDNQNGILAGPNSTSDIVVEKSEFAANGAGDGYTHNIYIGQVRTCTFRYNYSHHAKVGHNFKSRANANYIIANRIMDEASGTSSYVVDFPNGGLTYLIGNLIQQGPATSNRGFIVRYAEEGAVNPSQHLYAINNTIVNDYAGSTTFLDFPATTTVARVENNIFLGTGTAIGGTATSNVNNLVTTTSPLVSRSTYDYHLASGAAAINTGSNSGTAEGYALLPTAQYVHPASAEVRTTVGAAPDIGAYEYRNATNTAPVANSQSVSTAEDTAKAITLVASDADGNALTYAIVANPANGTLSGSGASRTYTPAANYNGADSFTFKANDGTVDSNTATVSITVAAVNDAPIVATPILDQSATVSVVYSFVVPLATFTDVDGGALTWSASGLPSWLTFTPATRTFNGTPAAGDVGATTITVTASDGTLSANDSFVLTVSVLTNIAPIISTGDPASLTMLEDVSNALTIAATDANGDTLTWTVLTQGTKGTMAVSSPGNSTTATYTPTTNLNGSDVVVVQVSDGKGGTDTITVNVTITAVNDAPSFTKGANQTVLEDAAAVSVTGWATAISTGPANEAAQTVAFTVTNTNNALFSVQPAVAANGTLTYTPAANANGSATVSINVTDNGGTTNGGINTSMVQTFTMTVTTVNDAPSFTKGANQTVLEDAAAVSVTGWATAI